MCPALAFGSQFLHDFSIKTFLTQYSINWQSFNVILFFTSHDIKQNVLLSSYLDNWDVINFKICLQSSSKAMADREQKGKEGNTKIWISRERKEFFRWNKKHSSSFVRGYSKIADTML